MSDDIPLIFAEELRAGARASPPVAVFLSANGPAQMQQYATAGWRVVAAPAFKSIMDVDLAKIPATAMAEEALGPCTLLACEALHLRPDTAARIQKWQPDIVKINCAFHGVADAAGLAPSLAAAGYVVLGAKWRDDNSFSIRSLDGIAKLDDFQPPDWDRLNLIGVRQRDHVRTILTVARLYAGEEQRIAELRVANAVRGDYIAQLEDALVIKQPSEIFKLQRS